MEVKTGNRNQEQCRLCFCVTGGVFAGDHGHHSRGVRAALGPQGSVGQSVSKAIKPGVTDGKHQQAVKLGLLTLSAVRHLQSFSNG